MNPAYYSTEGAFNGSGIALASQSFDSSSHGAINLYFQHHSGTIRWQQLGYDGRWRGGSLSEIVASDAKNSTPLSAVAYAKNGTATVSPLCCSPQHSKLAPLKAPQIIR